MSHDTGCTLHATQWMGDISKALN